MDINKRIIELCNERGWSIYTLALEAGLTQSTLSSMLQRGTPPKIDTLQAICDALGLTLAQFFSDTETSELLTNDELELIKSFRALGAEKQAALIALIKR